MISKVVPGINKNEIVWKEYVNTKGTYYYITSNKERAMYFCYKMIDGKANKLGQAKEPPSLEKKYFK